MELDSLSEVRILLVASKGSSTQILRTVFAIAGITKLVMVDEPRRAIEMLCIENFHAVFVEGAMEQDGMPFALAARRLPALHGGETILQSALGEGTTVTLRLPFAAVGKDGMRLKTAQILPFRGAA